MKKTTESKIRKLEHWLDSVYKPEPQPWKRKTLQKMSFYLLVGFFLGILFQLNSEVLGSLGWWILAFIGTLGTIGHLVAKHGSDFWVALVLGRYP